MNDNLHSEHTHPPIESHEKAIELIFHVLPNPKSIKNLDIAEPGKLYFEWRDSTYVLYLESGHINELFRDETSTLNKTTLLMELLISKHRLIDAMQKEEKERSGSELKEKK